MWCSGVAIILDITGKLWTMFFLLPMWCFLGIVWWNRIAFGVNATIRDYTHLKKGTLVAMGASITKQETEEWGVYVGNPAKKLEGKLSHEMY